MERFINIVLLDKEEKHLHALQLILRGSGNNVSVADSTSELIKLVSKKHVGIVFINMDLLKSQDKDLIEIVKKKTISAATHVIIIADSNDSASKLIKGLKFGAADFVVYPFHPNLVKAKVDVLKNLYFKDVRIMQLLKNIFPEQVLLELDKTGRFKPRRNENATVLFTDFIGFSQLSKTMKPLEIVAELDFFFNKFDEIVKRYKLEKIKTIGDAYMCISGVNDDNGLPEVRATLAAIEMRNFVQSKMKKKPNWKIRIGLHAGPLVAGIIGSNKMTFDVWGDTVNIASRIEHSAENNQIAISTEIAHRISDYINIAYQGKREIKHGAKLEVFKVLDIKEDWSLFQEGLLPNSKLREKCDLQGMDFDHAKRYIVKKLQRNLPKHYFYHSHRHTLNVEKSAVRIAKLEGVNRSDILLLRTACLLHDVGYIFEYQFNESLSIEFAKEKLPKFGYSNEEIEVICKMINATKLDVEPVSLLEKIICDADHDYLGRADYQIIANDLRKELEAIGKFMSDLEWVDFQLDFLQKHNFYTNTAQNIRGAGKKNRIQDLLFLKEELKRKHS
ncbi:MAG: response regulator [Crocinitomicaceae bacterium]|nr:response regulator [Crocinitomicaceae bacterium]